MFRKLVPVTEQNDDNLVMSSLGGSKEAFCEIVARYQNLICSIAYAAIGDLKQSEDLAQETFVEAWRKLDSLSDPAKLKAWLCGILRFKVSHYRRKETSQPILEPTELDDSNKHISSASLEDDAIDDQHEALLWKALDAMESSYREPLVLFYRQQQSVAKVAQQLDLTPETVKQRLSRGRKLLKHSMSDFVEQTLEKSKPGVGFTTAVLLSINTISHPTQAAMLGVSAAKSSSFFSVTTIVSILAPMSGFISSFFGLQAGLAQSRTEREKQFTKRYVFYFNGTVLLCLAILFGLRQLALAYPEQAWQLSIIAHTLVIIFICYYLKLTLSLYEKMQQLRAHERIFCSEQFNRPIDQAKSTLTEYKSRLHLCGVPLCHFQFGMVEAEVKPAKAWIACGGKAYGLLFAWGGTAIAPISVGIISIGIVSVGVIGFGLFALATIAVGALAFGSSAIGYKAYGWLTALGYESAASGGFSSAIDAALGYIAFADHVHTEKASDIASLTLLSSAYPWILAFIILVVVAPSFLYSKAVKKRMK